jgi:hypothetical protein
MKDLPQGQSRLKRSTSGKLRKNAASKKSTVVIPAFGVDELRARIGAPFEPMDFRQLIAQARQKNPARVDQVFKRMVAKTTAKQLNTLLAAMRVKRKDPAVFQKAFLALAVALLGVGQVVWTKPHSRKRTWTREDEATLFWLVHDLMDRDASSARGAVGKIASDEFLASIFPYQAKELPRSARLSAADRRFGALWQAWNKANRRKDEIISGGRPIPFHGVFGGKLGQWEVKLIELDTQHAGPKPGKKRPQ